METRDCSNSYDFKLPSSSTISKRSSLEGASVPLRTTYTTHKVLWLSIKLPYPQGRNCFSKEGKGNGALGRETGDLGSNVNSVTNCMTLDSGLNSVTNCMTLDSGQNSVANSVTLGPRLNFVSNSVTLGKSLPPSGSWFPRL